MKPAIFILFIIMAAGISSCKKNNNPPNPSSACDVVSVTANPNFPVYWSPDKTKYFVNKQDSAGVYQIYTGNAGSNTLTDISSQHTNGNCCGLFRHWKTRNKMQVQWHPSGNYIICVVEKEFYPELLYVPYIPIRLGILQTGIWMDVWAVKPDGSQWYQLANTVHGVTGPAFTPDGTTCVWAEAQDSANIFVDIFGKWKLWRANFSVSGGTPSFTNKTDISPAGSRWLEPGNFSPDGKSLTFNSDIGMTNAEGQDQYIMDITNGNIVNLTNSPKIWDEHGVFSPDGKKILFMSSYPYRADTNFYHWTSIKTDFMLMNRDGTGLQQLTHFRKPGYPEYHNGIASTGFFSEDGSTIYAQSLSLPDYNNWIIKFKGNCGKQ